MQKSRREARQPRATESEELSLIGYEVVCRGTAKTTPRYIQRGQPVQEDGAAGHRFLRSLFSTIAGFPTRQPHPVGHKHIVSEFVAIPEHTSTGLSINSVTGCPEPAVTVPGSLRRGPVQREGAGWRHAALLHKRNENLAVRNTVRPREESSVKAALSRPGAVGSVDGPRSLTLRTPPTNSSPPYPNA